MKIKLNVFSDVKEFIEISSNVLGDVTLKQGRYVINGKSLMGIFSLDLSKEVELITDEYDVEAFKKFIVE